MGLESANFIDGLQELNPIFEDFLAEGDDHIRAIKRALKATIPGMVGRAWRKVDKSISGPITLQENMTLQAAAAGITLTPDDAAVLGNGWMVMIKTPTTGSASIDAAQKINGSDAAYVIPAGHIAMLMTDGSEFFAVIMYQSTPAQTPSFAAGTKLSFHQTTAPSGWTKLTNSQYNNAAIRMTTGVVATGGLDDFTATFGTGKNTAGHTLTLSQSAPHAHGHSAKNSGGAYNLRVEAGAPWIQDGGTTDSQGGGGSHSHGLNNMNIKYVDMILAEKT